MTEVINWNGDSGDGVYIGGGDPKDKNHTRLRAMPNKLDAITIGSIQYLIKDASNPELGEEYVQEKWTGTDALEFYNEHKKTELKKIPGTDFSFEELKYLHVENALNQHRNDTTLNGMGSIYLEEGDLGFGNYEDNHIMLSSRATNTNHHGNHDGSSLTIQAFRGNDAIFANDQDSYIFGAAAGLLVDGSYANNSDHDYIHAGGGSDAAYGAGGSDFIEGNEGNDFLYGGQGSDILLGGEGGDKLYGGKGIDILVGGIGNDTLTGNNGEDVFVFGGNPLMHFYQNVITDFGNGMDTIVFADTFENLDLHVRESRRQGKIFVKSGVTGIDILEVRGSMGTVEISSDSLFSLAGDEPGFESTYEVDGHSRQTFADVAASAFVAGWG